MHIGRDDSFDEEELTEYHVDQADAEPDPNDSIASSISSKRGRPAIPEQWTKVISLDHDNLSKVKAYTLASDLLAAPNLPLESSARKRGTWKPHFLSSTFLRGKRGITLEQYKLKDTKLKQLAVLVSKRRAQFRAEAEKEQRRASEQMGHNEEEVKQAVKKISYRSATRPIRYPVGTHLAYKELVPPGSRRKSRKRGPLSVSTKIEIVHQVLVEHEQQQDIARMHRVGIGVVNNLVRLA